MPALHLSGQGGYHAPETATVSVLLLRELLDALYGCEARDLGRLAADLAHLIDIAKWNAVPL